MANSKIYLGNTNIGSLFQGASDISIYLGENKVYPLETPLKFQATYSGGETYELACDGNTTLNTTNTKPTGYEYSAMTEAVIGDCVTSIDGRILWGCISLSSVTIPDSVTSIGTYAFYNCSSLTSIDIPSGVTSITNGLFESCSSLSSVDLPSGVTSIGDGAFYECSGLTSIVIPDSVTSIGSQSFSYCSGFASIDIPSGVTSISQKAFQYCNSLSSVTVEATTPPTLGTSAFDNTNNCPIYVPCESVEAYKSASGWSDYASRITCPPFEGKWKARYSDSHVESAQCDATSAITSGEVNKTNLVSVEIGDCVTTIGKTSFLFSKKLTGITISDGVTTIAEDTFYGCSALTSINIPDSVTSIGTNAFYNCNSLPVENNIRYADTCSVGAVDKTLSTYNLKDETKFIGDGAFLGCNSLTGITIPNNVISIGDSAFYGCSALTSVNIPDSVTSIGTNAFNYCTSLTSVTVNAITPPTFGTSAFNNTNNCPIYVPAASVEDYKAAQGWSTYASRIQAIP